MADLLAKLGLDKLERAVLYGVILAVILALASWRLGPAERSYGCCRRPVAPSASRAPIFSVCQRGRCGRCAAGM